MLHVVRNNDGKVVKHGAAELLWQTWAKVFEQKPADEIFAVIAQTNG